MQLLFEYVKVQKVIFSKRDSDAAVKENSRKLQSC